MYVSDDAVSLPSLVEGGSESWVSQVTYLEFDIYTTSNYTS